MQQYSTAAEVSGNAAVQPPMRTHQRLFCEALAALFRHGTPDGHSSNKAQRPELFVLAAGFSVGAAPMVVHSQDAHTGCLAGSGSGDCLVADRYCTRGGGGI